MSRFSCLWIPHFEAWAMATQQPLPKLGSRLTSEPVSFIVVARQRVVAACPAALSKGIQAGFSVAKARSLCPELQVVPLHSPTVQVTWGEVLRTFADFTPYIESLRPGLLLGDVHRPNSLVPLLRSWNAHAGVADDRTTAELAAYTAAAGTLRTVRSGCSAAYLRAVPVTVLGELGVKAEVVERLSWFGWHSMGHLGALSKRQLQSQFQQGDLLYRYAQANDTRPVGLFRPSPQLHSRITFEEPVAEPAEVIPAIPFMLERLRERLDGRLAQTITVAIETPTGTNNAYKQSQILRDPTASLRTLCQVAEQLLVLLLQPRPTQPNQAQLNLSIERLEIVLGGLAQPTPRQESLFGPARPFIVEAVDAVERRFPAALQRFVVVDRQAYLPEHFARLEPLAADSLGNSSSPKGSSSAPSTSRRIKSSALPTTSQPSTSQPAPHHTTKHTPKASSTKRRQKNSSTKASSPAGSPTAVVRL